MTETEFLQRAEQALSAIERAVDATGAETFSTIVSLNESPVQAGRLYDHFAQADGFVRYVIRRK